MRNSTSINAFKVGPDLFKLSKPDSPNGFWKLSEEIFNRISNKIEQVNYLLDLIVMLPCGKLPCCGRATVGTDATLKSVRCTKRVHTGTKTAKRALAGTQCPSAHVINEEQDLNLVFRPRYTFWRDYLSSPLTGLA